MSDKEVQKPVVPLLSVQDLFSFYSDNPISIRHIPGSENPADAFTKPVDLRLLIKYMAHSESSMTHPSLTNACLLKVVCDDVIMMMKVNVSRIMILFFDAQRKRLLFHQCIFRS